MGKSNEESFEVIQWEDLKRQLSVDDAREINVQCWKGHEDQIANIFSMYREQVNPLISVYNTITNEFPVGVMNELRDVFSHLTQSLLATDGVTVCQHLNDAKRHLKRAVVDGYKYASMAYLDFYLDFRAAYKNVDLSFVDNCKFLPRLARLTAEANEAMHQARMIESDIHDDEAMYAAYEKAFNCYASLYSCVLKGIDSAEPIRLKSNEDAKAKKREHHIDRILAVAGVLFGLVSLIVGFFI